MKRTCKQFAILTYHRILATDHEAIGRHHTAAEISVTLRQFEHDLDLLGETATVLPLSVALRLAAEASLPDLPVVITFDDGFKEHFDLALPRLSARSLPATFFLCTQASGPNPKLRWIDCVYALAELHPGSTTLTLAGRQFVFLGAKGVQELKMFLRQMPPHEQTSVLRQAQQQLSVPDEALEELARRLYLDSTDALEMAGCQYVTLGGHGSTHACLGNLSAVATQWDVRDSYAAVRALTSTDFVPFAYPFGGPSSFSATTEAIVAAEGFSCACSAIPGLNQSDFRYHLHRFDVCRFPVASILRLLMDYGGM